MPEDSANEIVHCASLLFTLRTDGSQVDSGWKRACFLMFSRKGMMLDLPTRKGPCDGGEGQAIIKKRDGHTGAAHSEPDDRDGIGWPRDRNAP